MRFIENTIFSRDEEDQIRMYWADFDALDAETKARIMDERNEQYVRIRPTLDEQGRQVRPEFLVKAYAAMTSNWPTIRLHARSLWKPITTERDLKAGAHLRVYSLDGGGVLYVSYVEISGRPYFEHVRDISFRCKKVKTTEYHGSSYISDLGVSVNLHGAQLFRFNFKLKAALDTLSRHSAYAQYCAWWDAQPNFDHYVQWLQDCFHEEDMRKSFDDMIDYYENDESIDRDDADNPSSEIDFA